MNLNYQNSKLYMGESSLNEIIENNEGHPCYVYNLKNIEQRFQKFSKSVSGLQNSTIHYALKANGHSAILKKMKSLGAGVDVVSSGEMRIALESGFVPADVIFSGVAKSVEEIDFAIEQGIKQINVESTQELQRIGERGQLKNKKVAVAFRMNPEVNPITHPYITTGMSENKFGMDRSFLPELIRILKSFPDSLFLQGLTMHIGSQLVDLEAMDEAIKKLLSMYHELEVLGFSMKTLDIGGGVGIHYGHMDESEDFTTIDSYGRIVVENLKDFKGEVLFEPGRVLVGRSGVLLCQVEYIKQTSSKEFVIVNTGMHHLMRPALYQAEHRILPLSSGENKEQVVYDVVGPICESTDYLAKNRPMKKIEQGDFLAICDAGAYGFAMANNYNAHPLPKEIVID